MARRAFNVVGRLGHGSPGVTAAHHAFEKTPAFHEAPAEAMHVANPHLAVLMPGVRVCIIRESVGGAHTASS